MKTFVNSADSKETSQEIIDAIWTVSGQDEKRAERIWNGDFEAGEKTALWETITKNDLLDPTEFYWGEAGNDWATALGFEAKIELDIDIKKNEENFGKTGDGRYVLTQSPYISDNGETYQAQACDTQTGDEVTLFWDVIDAETDDESNACDWGEYGSKNRYKGVFLKDGND